MITVDTRGKLCPQPLIETRRALKKATTGDAITVMSDNDTAKDNILRFLDDQGASFECNEHAGIYNITFNKPASFEPAVIPEAYCSTAEPVTKDYIVVIANNKMGHGDDALGSILIKGFINALIEQDTLPTHLVFYNSGVQLTTANSGVLDTLKKMEEQGVRIIVCGTCVDFYEIKEQVGIGMISNMYHITEVMTQAHHIVKP